MKKEEILSKINFFQFYQEQIPSLKKNGKGEAVGLCPFHDDTFPSFSVNLESGLFNCFAGCKGGDVFDFYQRLKGVSFKDTLKDIGHMVGLDGGPVRPEVVGVFKYNDENRQVIYWKERIEPGRKGQKKEFIFYHSKDEKKVIGRYGSPLPYNLPELAKAEGLIYFVEGEAKADLLNQRGFTATCFDAGSGSPWKPDYLPYFQDKEVIILPDNDRPGRDYTERIIGALNGHVNSIKVVYLPGLPEKGDILDWVKDPGNTREKFLEIVESSPKWEPRIEEISESDASEESDEFPKDEKLIPLYPFDFDAFPPSLKKFINDTSKALQVEREGIASSILTISSAAIGNTVRVSPKMNWVVALFIWLMNIANTGYGKSHQQNTLISPINYLQAEAYREYRNAMDEYEAMLHEAKRNKKAPMPKPENKPNLTHYKVSDATVEALANVFKDSPRGTLIHWDELGGFILGLDQYKSKGKGNDRQHWLELFDAGSWKIDRKSGVMFIPNTGAAIIGGIQPQILPTLFSTGSFHDGLLPRFLMNHAKNYPQRFTRIAVGTDDLIYWENLLKKFYAIPLIIEENGFVKPKILILNEDAVNLWSRFHDEYKILGTFLSWKGRVFIPKLITYSLKLAGLLHVIKHLSEGDSFPLIISLETTHYAIELTKYFAGQAINVLRLYGTQNESQNEYQTRLVQTLWDLQGEVVNGKLLLEKIRIAFNDNLLEAVKLTHNKQVGTMLRKMGLKVDRGTGGPACLIFEMEKIKKLFLEKSSLSSLNQPDDAKRSDENEESEGTFLDEINIGN